MKVGDLVVHKSMNVTGIVLYDYQDCVEVLWSGCIKEIIGYEFIKVISESG